MRWTTKTTKFLSTNSCKIYETSQVRVVTVKSFAYDLLKRHVRSKENWYRPARIHKSRLHLTNLQVNLSPLKQGKNIASRFTWLCKMPFNREPQFDGKSLYIHNSWTTTMSANSSITMMLKLLLWLFSWQQFSCEICHCHKMFTTWRNIILTNSSSLALENSLGACFCRQELWLWCRHIFTAPPHYQDELYCHSNPQYTLTSEPMAFPLAL